MSNQRIRRTSCVIPSYGTFWIWMFAKDNVCTIIPPAPIALFRRIRYFRHLKNDGIECHRSAPHKMIIICQAFFWTSHISIWANSFVCRISVPLIKLIKLLRKVKNSAVDLVIWSIFSWKVNKRKTVHFNGSIRIYYSVIGIHLVLYTSVRYV